MIYNLHWNLYDKIKLLSTSKVFQQADTSSKLQNYIYPFQTNFHFYMGKFVERCRTFTYKLEYVLVCTILCMIWHKWQTQNSDTYLCSCPKRTILSSGFVWLPNVMSDIRKQRCAPPMMLRLPEIKKALEIILPLGVIDSLSTQNFPKN